MILVALKKKGQALEGQIFVYVFNAVGIGLDEGGHAACSDGGYRPAIWYELFAQYLHHAVDQAAKTVKDTGMDGLDRGGANGMRRPRRQEVH